ncbi:MAG: iron-sulfur cluster repair di-iron protein [Cyclobacteriaceae bacterium]|nr:iron-sulfur cluster repair di-iron protein [Cyclobacteriaceae bacterium]
MQPENLTVGAPTIGELVSQDWRKAEVFKKYGIDYCCGGKRTVADACLKKGIDSALVEADLDLVSAQPVESQHNFNRWELDFLADYIINNHHSYVTGAIPFLEELSRKVSHVHGDFHPELLEIEQHIRAVIEELTMHMPKEEIILFPYIKELVQAKKLGTPVTPPPFGTIANPIRMMEAEHITAGGAMEAIEKLSNRFTPPPDACMSYSVLFAKLKEFQQDLHQHIHLENNILFPKAIKLESELLSR